MSDKLKQFLNLITEIEQTEDLGDILDLLLTPKEYQEIANRVEIFKKLDEGETQRNISDELEVSIATVTRGSREMQNKPQKVQKLLDILEEIES